MAEDSSIPLTGSLYTFKSAEKSLLNQAQLVMCDHIRHTLNVSLQYLTCEGKHKGCPLGLAHLYQKPSISLGKRFLCTQHSPVRLSNSHFVYFQEKKPFYYDCPFESSYFYSLFSNVLSWRQHLQELWY